MTYAAKSDAIRGMLDGIASTKNAVSIACDGAHWATVCAFPDPQTGALEYVCALPPVEIPTRSTIVARASDGSTIASANIVREPLRSTLGLRAHDVYATDHQPFLAVPWLTFDGARITLSGMHLPPEGDPGKLEVAFEAGVSYTLDYGLPSPAFREHYWYWPNADLSGLMLTIDIAASARHSNPFHFQFVYPKPAGIGGGKRSVGVWLPKSFESFRGYPNDASQMTRVQSFSTSASVAVTGYNAFRTLEELFGRTGIERSQNPAILDWGCGHGRITCHFLDAWPDAEVFGTDIDAENVVWCNAHLKRGRFVVAPLWPPTSFEDATFDGVFGISVMTHLTAEAQRAWFAELARITKPGGTALLTFQAEGYAAYQSLWRDAAWWSSRDASSFDDEQLDPVLDGKIVDDDYYRNTVQSTQGFVAESSRDFELLWIEVALFGGYQDCAVLRRR